jgi:hypothetical protein
MHGIGQVTYADHFDPATGEWATATVDTSTLVVVGDFFGAQMSGFDVAPHLGLIDHIPDGELEVPYAERTVVVPAANAPFQAAISGTLPDGTTLDPFTGVFKGIPTAAGAFTFTVEARDLISDVVLASKSYTVTIAGPGVNALNLKGAQFASKNSRFGFSLTSPPGQSVIIEASTNLSGWLPVWTNSLGGALQFSDPQSGSYPARFYRAHTK